MIFVMYKEKANQVMATALTSKLRQYYRCYRNWQKYKKPSAKRKESMGRELQFYSQFIKKGDLCFDIGANIGDKTEVFLQLGAAVVAVEPQESCWRFLKRRYQNKNVHIVTKALGKAAGQKEIFIDRSHTLSSMSPEWIDSVTKSGRFSSHKWNYKITIETTTLDALIEEYRIPDFCKIDVEGFEWEVIQGLSQPVNMLSLEFVPEHLEPVLACIEYLSKLGNAEFNYSLTDPTSFVFPTWVDAGDMTNTLQTSRGESYIQGDIYVRFNNPDLVDFGA